MLTRYQITNRRTKSAQHACTLVREDSLSIEIDNNAPTIDRQKLLDSKLNQLNVALATQC